MTLVKRLGLRWLLHIIDACLGITLLVRDNPRSNGEGSGGKGGLRFRCRLASQLSASDCWLGRFTSDARWRTVFELVA
jgi:hypothetical protein